MSRCVGVFAFPVELDFYVGARHTHKQVMTLYNPYEFAVDFTMLCTAPHKFTVHEPNGAIAPLSSVDVVVRYAQPSEAHAQTRDRFRITMQERGGGGAALGRRDVPVRFHAGEPESQGADSHSVTDDFRPVSTKGSTPPPLRAPLCNHPAHRGSTPNVIAICIALGCIVALLLPTQQEPPSGSSLPVYLHLSVNLKLVFSFVLGLVSMVVIKP